MCVNTSILCFLKKTSISRNASLVLLKKHLGKTKKLQNCLNFLWHSFNNMTPFLRHNSITQLHQICWLYINVTLPFHHTQQVLCWITISRLWRPLKYSAISKEIFGSLWIWVHYSYWKQQSENENENSLYTKKCGQKEMEMGNHITQVGSGV